MLVAGGGTGGLTVFMGEQLNHTNAETVYLDFSTESMKVAMRRTRARWLKNIVWIHDWIEMVNLLGLGIFKHLDCSGVLHHLKKPILGLKSLKDSLTVNGGMNLMIYARYGRSAIYHMQDLFKIYKTNNDDIEKELRYATHTLLHLPVQSWLLVTIKDPSKHTKTQIYDLFLHDRDVAYSVVNLMKLANDGGLQFVGFDTYIKRFEFESQYDKMGSYLEKIITHRSENKKSQYVAELLISNNMKHAFYASRQKYSTALLQDDSNVLYLYGNPSGLKDAMLSKKSQVMHENETYFRGYMYSTTINNAQIQALYPKAVYNYSTYVGSKQGIKFGWKMSFFNVYLVNKLLQSRSGISTKNFFSEFSRLTRWNNSNNKQLNEMAEEFYKSVKDIEMFLLKKKFVRQFPKTVGYSLFRIECF